MIVVQDITTGVMRTSIACQANSGRKTPKNFKIMTIVSENSDQIQQEMDKVDKVENNVKKISINTPEKKISVCSQISKKSIQQKIYKKGKVKFDKSAKSFTKRLPRLVEKNGSCNVVSRTINGKQTACLSDLFITFIETKWRLVLPMFGMSVVISWIIFAGILYGISSARGDFQEELDIGHTTCVANTPDFFAMLLFSMETQTTIGYGSRYVNDECTGVIFVIMLQSIWGALLQALLTGVVIAKIQKPTKRGNTILFSKNVCISQEQDGKYISIRLADIQKSDMIETSVRAVCVVSTLTTDGDFISHFRHDMEFKLEKQYNRITFRWPIVLSHRLQPHSPLYNMDEDDLRNSDLELIVIMDGVIESTGMTVQARNSYIPSEFQWQHKFKPMLATITSSGVCEFDLNFFHETEEVPLIGITYAPYKRLRRVDIKHSPTPSDPGRESGFSDSMETDISSCSSDYSVFDSKGI